MALFRPAHHIPWPCQTPHSRPPPRGVGGIAGRCSGRSPHSHPTPTPTHRPIFRRMINKDFTPEARKWLFLLPLCNMYRYFVVIFSLFEISKQGAIFPGTSASKHRLRGKPTRGSGALASAPEGGSAGNRLCPRPFPRSSPHLSSRFRSQTQKRQRGWGRRGVGPGWGGGVRVGPGRRRREEGREGGGRMDENSFSSTVPSLESFH